MIQSRDSRAHLSPQEILMRVSEEEIFRRYISNFRQIGKKFISQLRQDKRPDVVVFIGKDGRLRYKDHACPEHSFDCFGYVMRLYGCSFKDSLSLISEHMGLGLTGGSHFRPVPKGMSIPTRHPYRKADIRIRRRDWKHWDREYWEGQYLISKDLLDRAGIVPITHYWINGHRFHSPKLCYAYTEHSPRFKIYSPHEEDDKWYSNVNAEDVQGRKLLKGSGKSVLLTSSLKDALVLRTIGEEAIALSSESVMPSEQMIRWLKARYESVEVFYDNDQSEKNPGQTMALRICEKYGLDNIRIPSTFGFKDPSDLVASQGPIQLYTIINEERETNRQRKSDDSGQYQVQIEIGSVHLSGPKEDECPF